MTHEYQIAGMTCNNCVAKVKSELLKMPFVLEATVQLAEPQATVTMNKHIPVHQLQEAVGKAGNYTITEIAGAAHEQITAPTATTGFAALKPLLLVFTFITGVTLLVQYADGSFNMMHWMRHFMAGFFLVFSFFKLLDLSGFADSYSTYDLVAKQWRGWSFAYPFIELLLGIALLVNFHPVITNAVTILVMSISLVGVLQSVLQKRQIRCACLGAVFNLPMSTITVAEDALMIVMSALMLGLVI